MSSTAPSVFSLASVISLILAMTDGSHVSVPLAFEKDKKINISSLYLSRFYLLRKGEGGDQEKSNFKHFVSSTIKLKMSVS